MTDIAGKNILLTGASRGIGLEMARALVKQGGHVIGVARSQQKLDRVSVEIARESKTATDGRCVIGSFQGIEFDLSQVSALEDLLARVRVKVGEVDILVNNAGIEIYREFQEYSTREIEQTITINLVSVMELSRLVLPGMLERNLGHIVNIASLASKKGHPFDSIYSASKGGLLLWGDSLRQELTETQVRVSTICPGYVSDRGMLADTGIPAPKLSGTSTAAQVANATIEAIERNRAEIVVNQDRPTEFFSKLLFAIWELFPQFGDRVYQWMGIPEANKVRISSRSF